MRLDNKKPTVAHYNYRPCILPYWDLSKLLLLGALFVRKVAIFIGKCQTKNDCRAQNYY